MTEETVRIAIIGGGVSGLATAYEILTKAEKPDYRGPALQVHIYEKGTLGGNARTVAFNLGIMHDGSAKKQKYIRWCDLGVNDINLTAYENIKRVMLEIGYITENPVTHEITGNLKPLENTACFFSADGDTTYTDDEDLEFGVSNPKNCLQIIQNGEYNAVRNAINSAALEQIYGTTTPTTNDPIQDLETTVEVFFDMILGDVATYLKPHLDPNKFNYSVWQPETCSRIKRIVKVLRDNVFYPRISAMYFANDIGPEMMLLAAPFQYYLTQESVGKTPDRRYFHHGTRSWVEALEENMERFQKADQYKVIYSKDGAKVDVQADQFVVTDGDNEEQCNSQTYDYCVVATHADDALKALHFNIDEPSEQHRRELQSLELQCRRILEKVDYTQSIAVAHTFSRLLPPERDSWRTYNVLIRKGESLKPYSMTYVCNRHQNDAEKEGPYNYANLPQFFVTLNPQTPIPEDFILHQAPYEDLPSHMRTSLPKHTTLHAKTISENTNKDKSKSKAIAYFRHNLLNHNCFKAQEDLKNYHNNFETRLFFSGGWSNKSGLHEDCWQQGCDIQSLLFRKWI